MFTINRSEVTRRYEVGNDHMACQDISGNDVMIVLVVYFMVLALSLFIILMIVVQGWCVNKVWSWNLDWVNSESVRTVLNKDLWKEVIDIKWELKSLPISKRKIGLSSTDGFKMTPVVCFVVRISVFYLHSLQLFIFATYCIYCGPLLNFPDHTATLFCTCCDTSKSVRLRVIFHVDPIFPLFMFVSDCCRMPTIKGSLFPIIGYNNSFYYKREESKIYPLLYILSLPTKWDQIES